MKRVLVVSDIHGNWEALRAITEAEPSDVVVCLGDIVDYGPRPAHTAKWVEEHATATVRGNHDNAVAFGVSCRSAPLFRRLSEESRKLTVPLMSAGTLAFLRGLPERVSLALDGLRLELLHAAPADPLFQYLPATNLEGWRHAVEDVDADIVLVGHTHIPAFLNFGNKFVVNPGSVGLPRDGDARACYAVLDGCNVQLKRIAYDVEGTVKALREWGLPHDVSRSLERIYRGESPEKAIPVEDRA